MYHKYANLILGLINDHDFQISVILITGGKIGNHQQELWKHGSVALRGRNCPHNNADCRISPPNEAPNEGKVVEVLDRDGSQMLCEVHR